MRRPARAAGQEHPTPVEGWQKGCGDGRERGPAVGWAVGRRRVGSISSMRRAKGASAVEPTLTTRARPLLTGGGRAARGLRGGHASNSAEGQRVRRHADELAHRAARSHGGRAGAVVGERGRGDGRRADRGDGQLAVDFLGWTETSFYDGTVGPGGRCGRRKCSAARRRAGLPRRLAGVLCGALCHGRCRGGAWVAGGPGRPEARGADDGDRCRMVARESEGLAEASRCRDGGSRVTLYIASCCPLRPAGRRGRHPIAVVLRGGVVWRVMVECGRVRGLVCFTWWRQVGPRLRPRCYGPYPFRPQPKGTCMSLL